MPYSVTVLGSIIKYSAVLHAYIHVHVQGTGNSMVLLHSCMYSVCLIITTRIAYQLP